MQNNILLSVLIVNYNGINLLRDCINSLRDNINYPYEIIVVDNNSTDGSVEYLKRYYPYINLITSYFNKGFTGGNNLAASYAKGEYLLLLNTDTVITSCIDPLINIIKSNHKIGVLGCRLFYGDRKLQESIGYEPNFLNLAISWIPLPKKIRQSKFFSRTVSSNSLIYDQELIDVDWISGAFLLTTSLLWKKLDGLDENFFMYMEDVDYCRRVRDLNYSVCYSKIANVIHYEGAGRLWIGKNAIINTTNSYIIYYKKYYNIYYQYMFKILLIVIFSFRVIAHTSTYFFDKDVNGKEKGLAYYCAIKILLKN